MGVAVGLAALSRSELILLSVMVIVPLVLLVRTVPLGRRIGWITAAAATCLGVVGPWVLFNMTRFDHPVYLSAGYEITLSTATCDLTWYGEFTGYWNIQCPIGVLQRHGVDSRGADQSELAKLFRQDSIDYIRSHEKRLPYVLLALGAHHRPLQAPAAGEPRPLPRGAQHLGRPLCPRRLVHRRSARDRRRVRVAQATHPGLPAARSTGDRLRRGHDHVRDDALPRVRRRRDLPARRGGRRRARPDVRAPARRPRRRAAARRARARARPPPRSGRQRGSDALPSGAGAVRPRRGPASWGRSTR